MAQQGFVYESNAYKALQDYEISTGGVAGASHDKPDLSIITKSSKTSAGCELKISPTAAGSLVMKYYKDTWDYGETNGDPEKELMKSIGEKNNLLKNMNASGAPGRNWRSKVPVLQNDASGKKILTGDIKDKRTAYAMDIKSFGGINEVHINVSAKDICNYYNKKKTQYINVGTHGFYLMNSSDPLGLNEKLTTKIPDFANSASAKIRVRCQYKGSGDYQFVMTLEFNKMTKSPYNLCPIISKDNVAINKVAMGSLNNKLLLNAFNG